MKFLQNDSGQAGGIILVIMAVFIVGFFYVAFGALMNQTQVVNNQIITDGQISYSQDHWNVMDMLFKAWWAFPIYFILLIIIFAIKNSLEREPSEV